MSQAERRERQAKQAIMHAIRQRRLQAAFQLRPITEGVRIANEQIRRERR